MKTLGLDKQAQYQSSSFAGVSQVASHRVGNNTRHA